jgi:3-phenylpropionate/cinnamic acid dioxygenase small subunit
MAHPEAPELAGARLRPGDLALHHEIELFLYHEAALLDTHDYDAWLALMAPEIDYRMPTRYNRLAREKGKATAPKGELAHFEDDLAGLRERVDRIQTGLAWAEAPPSRTRHLVTNVRVWHGVEGTLEVESNFLLYRTRLELDVEVLAGARYDTLVPGGEHGRLIRRRLILLDQTTTVNLTVIV